MKNILNISLAANIAVHGLAYMASCEKTSVFSSSEISKAIQVSESHLSKVMQRLVRGGILISTRGAKGGFKLNKDPKKLSVLEIIELIDGSFDKNGCLLGKPVCDNNNCQIQQLLRETTNTITSALKKMKLIEITIPAKNNN